MTVEITEAARESIKRTVLQAADSGGKEGAERALDLLSDIYDCFQAIEASGGAEGAVHPHSGYNNARIVSLSRYDGLMVAYLKEGRNITILGLMYSWMTGI